MFHCDCPSRTSAVVMHMITVQNIGNLLQSQLGLIKLYISECAQIYKAQGLKRLKLTLEKVGQVTEKVEIQATPKNVFEQANF